MKEERENWIERRNDLLKSFFSKSDLPFEVKVFDVNKPMVMLGNKVMNCYVHNFNLKFTNKAINGDTIFEIKLNKYVHPDELGQDFYDWVHNYEHRETYKIQLGNENLFLSGYNFTNREKGEGRYPVFASLNYKIYFNKEYAENICRDYKHLFKSTLKVT